MEKEKMEAIEGSTPAKQQAAHVALLATPGMGHLIPVAELAKRIVGVGGGVVTATLITFASTASAASQRDLLASLPPSIASVSLPPVDLSDLPPGSAIETLMSEECSRLVPALTAILSGLRETTRLVAFVTDLFGTDSFDAAVSAGVSRRCLFFTANLQALTLFLHLPELDVSLTETEFRDLSEPVRLPGCVAIPGPDILSSLQDKSDPSYPWMLHHAKRFREAQAILVNSFDAVEPDTAAVLRLRRDPGRPPVYNIGPLIRTTTTGEEEDSSAGSPAETRHACLDWLDRQPPKSVIFVSFGSGGSLPREQLQEVALGLELSGHRFLWVVRSPSDDRGDTRLDANYYYDAHSKNDPLAYLPQGFLERTKDAAFLVPSWAPQAKVLAHPAVGGFLMHCGWNSVLESLVHGVPMLAWPLYAEQRQNSVMLTKGVGAALGLGLDNKTKHHIAAAVREVMEGTGVGAQVRAKVAELQEAAPQALRDGGAVLDDLVRQWIMHA